MQEPTQGTPVIREDGMAGKVVTMTAAAGATMLVIQFDDGSRVAVAPDMLAAQADGVYRLLLAASRLALDDEVVIPVIEEEIVVSKQQVERGVVRVHKRVETREETVDTSLLNEEVHVEHVPINTLVEGAVPQIREEGGVIIIPLLEEVLVVEKRLLLREEVRLAKRATTYSAPQTVTVHREIAEIERTPLDDPA
jgi:uncharacterized protein (TIGR02271 family)